MAERFEITVSSQHKGERLDRYLSEQMCVTRSAVERLLSQAAVTVLGGDAVKNYRLRGGEVITALIEDPVPAEAQPENIPLDIVYEDEDIIVVNKPQGMVVHPAAGNESGTLVNALLYHCGGSLSGVGGVARPGIVHRIDKDTSGLLVVAKNDFAHNILSEQLKTHTVSRLYHAITVGNLREDSGTVNKPIARHPVDRKRMAVAKTGEGREAVTHFEVLEHLGSFSHVCCRLETGRTHQIRVHMASLGHPLLGDSVYGGDGTAFQARHRSLFAGQCLHASELRLIHPRTEREMTFHAPLPANFDTVLLLLRKEFE